MTARLPGSGRAVTARRQRIARVEPIRHAVNALLEGADPILSRYRERRLSARDAQRRLGALERRFAQYRKAIGEVRPVPPALATAQWAYAHTYVLEDAYLRALVAAIPRRNFSSLPKTQDAQRAAIVAWRRRLEEVAKRLGARLPADVQIAGRGEIAPSPFGD